MINHITKSFLAATMSVASVLVAGAVAPEPGVMTGTAGPGSAIEGAARLTTPAKATAGNMPQRIGERNPLVPPFMEIFDDFPKGSEHEEFERLFQVIDANNDTRTWALYNYSDDFYSKCAYLMYPLDEGALPGVPGRGTADDWLIPRAIRLEGGKYYNIRMDASLWLDGADLVFEVKMGEHNDVEGMTFDVIPPTHVTSMICKEVRGWFKAPDDGLYYMGIHGISERGGEPGYLFIDNIAIDAPFSGREPDQVSSLSFVNDPMGTTGVEVSFNAPSTAIDGSALTGTVDITVLRGTTVIGTFEGKTPGEKLSFKDDPGQEGDFEYTFKTSNSNGNGCDYKVKHHAGFAAPVAPVITGMKEISDGVVELSWSTPETDLNGNAIDPSVLTYNIYDFSTDDKILLESGVKGNSHTVEAALIRGGQTVLFMLVSATLNGKESTEAPSGVMIVGFPYGYPYSYSFVEAAADENVLSTDSDEGVSWRLLDNYSDPRPQDGDGGYVCMIGDMPGQHGELSTGKIEMSDAQHPFVSFYTYVYGEDENEVSVSVVDCATNEKTLVKTFKLEDYNRIGWTHMIVPIEEFAGRVVRVCLGGTIETHGYIPFDNLVVGELEEVDLYADIVMSSQYATTEDDYTVIAGITNTGYKTVDKYTVKLYCDGQCVATSEQTAPLASMATNEVTLKGRFSAVSPATSTFYVEVETDGDANVDNDRTQPFAITFLAPNHPIVKDLAATESGNAVNLTWSAPDLTTAAPEPSFEDFESYPTLCTELNGWTMYDGDKGYVAGYNGIDLPFMETQQAWWTVRKEAPYDFMPTLGQSSLVQMVSYDEHGHPVTCDDWIISPELYGGRQCIEFFARSMTVDYGYETFEVYYSLTDNKRESFKIIMYETRLEDYWTQFFVSLPEGTKYFAIRCTSNDVYHMMLDNITYTAKGTPMAYDLKGYNVYRNGVKVNDALVTEPSFTSTRELEGDDYFVTAVYDRGESTASNIVHIGKSGIEDIEATPAEAEYFDLRGMRVRDDKLAPGIYIMRQGNRVTKIVR